MYKKVSIILIACVCSLAAAQTDTFDVGKKDFLLNGEPVVIRSGELHYPEE
ncbi:MAG: beta-galactosidase [Kiritimatiellaceae bacterium]|nr:beta-galactosidase [Kiritimatiellaceae bacterium]